MGVEKIIELIEREAEEEAAAIVAAAERDARESVAAADAHVTARVTAALERLGPEIRAAEQRRVNAVRLRILEERARDDASRLTAVFDAAETRVREIAEGGDAQRWSAALGRLCADALASVGEGASVEIRFRDAPSIAAAASRWKATLETIADDEPASLRATSHDGRIEVDAGLGVRAERARSLLAERVSQALALTPGDLGEEPAGRVASQ